MPIDYSAPRRGKGKSKLAALRIAAGLTQEELARLSGVSVFVVKEIEAGRTNRRTLESLVRIAAAIGVTPLDIIKMMPRTAQHQKTWPKRPRSRACPGPLQTGPGSHALACEGSG